MFYLFAAVVAAFLIGAVDRFLLEPRRWMKRNSSGRYNATAFYANAAKDNDPDWYAKRRA